MSSTRKLGVGLVALAAILGIAQMVLNRATVQAQQAGAPRFEVDHTWPKLPENMYIGTVSGIIADAQNHVWVIHRPSTVANGDLASAQKTTCCVPAPPVLEFDQAGNYIQGWGDGGTEVHSGGVQQLKGKEERTRNPAGYYWPRHEHGVYVDYKGNVWVGGNGEGDNHILKFTRNGKFLMMIGNPTEKATGNLDQKHMQLPTKVWVSPKTNEAFVADGYMNRRVIVFDADTGAFKRFWSAYGNKPTDPPEFTDHGTPRVTTPSGRGPEQFNLPHALSISKDDMVYVADRLNNRAQVFKLDGSYVNELWVNRTTLGNGTVFDLDFSGDPNQTYLYIADNTNGKVQIYNRQTLQFVGNFGRPGRNAGQFDRIHSMAADGQGNIYTGETNGRRVQKFVFKGMSSATQ